jgi:hypothetical protein
MEYEEIEVPPSYFDCMGCARFCVGSHMKLLTKKYISQEGPRFPITQCNIVYIYLGTCGAARLYYLDNAT